MCGSPWFKSILISLIQLAVLVLCFETTCTLNLGVIAPIADIYVHVGAIKSLNNLGGSVTELHVQPYELEKVAKINIWLPWTATYMCLYWLKMC